MKPQGRSRLLRSLLLTALLVLAGGCRTGSAVSDWAFDDQDGIAVSPNGKQIVFVGNDGRGGSDLFLLDLATNKVRRLANTPEIERQPSFSHSGKLIVYTAGADWPSPPCSLYVRSLDGKFVKRLTNEGDKRMDLRPSFSSDDEKITFSGAFAPKYNEQDIFIIGVDGKNLRRVTHDGFNCNQHPRFYRGDTSLVFETYQFGSDPFRNDPPMVTSEYDLAAGSWKEKIHLGKSTGGINVSPDGKGIVFGSDPVRFQHDVFYAPSLDAPPQSLKIASIGHGSRAMYIAPQQQVVYFLMNDLQIWRVGLDGRGLVRIADVSLFDDPLRWKP